MSKALAAIKRLLVSAWFWLTIATLVLCLLIWFVGPLIALGERRPLGSPTARLATLLAIVTLWGLGNLLFRARQVRVNRKLIEELQQRDAEAEAEAEANRTAAEEDLAAIGHRASEVLESLKRARFGRGWFRRYVYQLPWYLMIGPPGSGKTTALLNSGLVFPLAERFGKKWVSGLGGTRNCDWMVSEQAVLVDTAGRYTDQRSGTAVDASVWAGFLALLKKYRPRQPINGVLVLISPVELAAMNEADREAQATSIRHRLLELRRLMGVRFPVYVLFSKLDLVFGFDEFFESLGREERAQVWGTTFSLDNGKGENDTVAEFGTAFDALMERLDRRLIKRLQEEPDHSRRARIFDFPMQMAALKPVIENFLNRVFRSNRFEAPLLLRGTYFTSGTQAGIPADFLSRAVAPAFGMDPGRLSPHPELPLSIPRSCFLQRLFPDVIFAEARLAGFDLRLETARRYGVHALAAALSVLVIGLSALWYMSFQSNRAALESAVVGADRVDREQQSLRVIGSSEADLANLATVLDALRALPGGFGTQARETAMPVSFGLYSLNRLSATSNQTYLRGLRNLLLPRLLARLQSDLKRPRQSPVELFQALKVYLMVGRRGPVDPDLAATWVDLDLRNRLPDNPALHARLMVHVRALIGALPAQVALDEPTIAAARAQLSGTTLAMRGYDLLRSLPVAKNLPPWRPLDHAGASAATVLLRPSGRSLLDGIDGLYTRQGFFDVVLPSVGKIAEAEAHEGWVLGLPDDAKAIPARTRRVRQDMLNLYFDDYGRAWDAMLADVVAAPFRSPAQAANALNVLSGPNSPLKAFLAGVAEQTDLDAPPPSPASQAAGKASAAAAAAGNLANQAALQASQALGAGPQLAQAGRGLAPEPPGHPITVRFQPLRDSVAGVKGAPPPIDDTLKAMRRMYEVFNKIALAPPDAAAQLASSPELRDAVAGVLSQKDSLPPPFGNVVVAIANSGSAVVVGGAQAYMKQVWLGEPMAMCKAVVDRRFPFDSTSSQAAPVGDLTALLAPNGVLDQFFNTHLKPFVDTAAHPWRWRRADNVDLGLPNEVLAQFERAAAIRAALFQGDAGKLSVPFEIEPVKVDQRINSLVLTIDGQRLIYSNGPITAVAMRWPGPENAAGARLSFSPDRDVPTTLGFSGPLGFLRLLAAGTLIPDEAPDYFFLKFDIGGRTATFRIHAASVHNLFGELADLRAFRCPAW